MNLEKQLASLELRKSVLDREQLFFQLGKSQTSRLPQARAFLAGAVITCLPATSSCSINSISLSSMADMSPLQVSISWASAMYSSFLRVWSCWLAYFSISDFLPSTSNSNCFFSDSSCFTLNLAASRPACVDEALSLSRMRSGSICSSWARTCMIWRSRS